jgi:hypothetical protein
VRPEWDCQTSQYTAGIAFGLEVKHLLFLKAWEESAGPGLGLC